VLFPRITRYNKEQVYGNIRDVLWKK
jgi:hypothetical protein